MSRQVGVLMGGPSAEREVSLRSGQAVANGLRQAGYDVQEIDVESASLNIPQQLDGVFIALHGTFGEDGQVQALLQEQGMAYTGADSQASRMAFDKILSKNVFAEQNILTPRYEMVQIGQGHQLPLPLVVKPTDQGSSIGIHLVRQEDDWNAAVADAYRHGSQVIAEEYIAGRELTVGIVDDQILPIIEIEAPDQWYDYGAKYTKGQSEYRVPATLGLAIAQKCQQVSRQTYQALNCRGMGRVDIRLDNQGQAFVLEINTIPGFTETSLLPKAAAAAGITFCQLCDRIMRTAFDS